MDPRLLRYYNRELEHVRQMGAEFAQEFPKIARRLGLEEFECADPYVERLLEGFAFLAGRVQLKIDAEFPRFTQHLLEMVYPHYLAPVPSMAVVELAPDLKEGALATGFTVPRGTALRGGLGRSEQTRAEYRTAHDVTLWPLEIVASEYHTRDLMSLDVPEIAGAKAALLLRLRTTAGLTFDKLSLDRLTLHFRGSGDLPARVYEQLLGQLVGIVVRPAERPATWREVLPPASIERTGMSDGEALLPQGPRSFSGHRLLREYFAFPQRFLFATVGGLAPAVRRAKGRELDIVFLLGRADAALENVLEPSHFSLFATPAVNLFPKHADRIHLSEGGHEHHVVPDRARPMDFEVFEVSRVLGYGAGGDEELEFFPFYAANDLEGSGRGKAFFALRRAPRLLSARQRGTGPRSSYIGSETWLSLVDASEAPYSSDLRQLGIETLCTNRDLALQMPVGQESGDFAIDTAAPVAAARVVSGPTRPKPSYAEGETAWRLISHLSLNYLSIADSDVKQGAAALRELLMLYCDPNEAHVQRQIEGVRSVRAEPITRRLPFAGPTVFGRGLDVSVTFDEAAFEGVGIFLLGAVLEQFFARYASINSFTETHIHSVSRGEVMRWPARIGRRPIL